MAKCMRRLYLYIDFNLSTTTMSRFSTRLQLEVEYLDEILRITESSRLAIP